MSDVKSLKANKPRKFSAGGNIAGLLCGGPVTTGHLPHLDAHLRENNMDPLDHYGVERLLRQRDNVRAFQCRSTEYFLYVLFEIELPDSVQYIYYQANREQVETLLDRVMIT